MAKITVIGKGVVSSLKSLRLKAGIAGKSLIADVDSLRLKALVASKHLIADVVVGKFILSSNFFNAIGLADLAAKALGLNKNDQVDITESLALDYSKSVDDIPGVSDIAALAVTRLDADTFSATDAVVSDIGKNISDIVYFADDALRETGFGAGDTVYATDDVGAEATIDDDQYMQFGKNVIDIGSVVDSVALTAAFDRQFTESISITDVIEKGYPTAASDSMTMSEIIELLAEKSISDTLDSADSGSLISQDYVDNNQYFDADYVGQYRTF